MVKEIQSSHTQCKLAVMDTNDSGALQLVLFNKRMMTQHKSKWIGPSQREAWICRGAIALCFEIEMNNILSGILSLST